MSAQQMPRPRMHLGAASDMYPVAWRRVDQLRAERGGGLPEWPVWCFLPLSGWYLIVSEDAGVQMLPPRLVGDVSRLAALGTWRVTQGIYRLDPALYDAVIATPVDGDLPCDVLYRLPEWCVYVETPGLTWAGSALHGVFAHLEWDANTARHELRLVLDSEDDLAGIALHIGAWTLQESVDRMVREATRQGQLRGGLMGVWPGHQSQDMAASLAPIISVLLYLCCANAEIGGARRPENPVPKRTKTGMRIFPADRPTVWDVGVRMGAALRRAYQAAETGGGQLHAGPRPHVRRAHWHGFWSGPKNTPEERKLGLKWLPPISVNVDDSAPIVPTVRPVR